MLTRSSYTEPIPQKDYGNGVAANNGVHNDAANNQQMVATPAVDNTNATGTATHREVTGTHNNQSAV
jgi:hypothetical protein